MAAGDAKPIPRKFTAYRVTFPIHDANGDPVTGAASLDSEVSRDGAAFADAANETVEIANGLYYLDLDTGDMAGDTIAVAVKSNQKQTNIVIYPEEVGDIRVDVKQIDGDTGAADQLQKAFASGFADTGINDRLGRIGFDVDTGLRAQLSDVDTGLHDAIADLDTGLRGILNTTGVNVTSIDGDTGSADSLAKAWNGTGTVTMNATLAGTLTGNVNGSVLGSVASVTAGVNVDRLGGDTGALNWLKQTYASGFSDTGLNERLGRIQSDVDTGLRVHIDDSDTGVKDAIADLDTGLRDYIDNTDTGLRARINTLAEDTGGVNINSIAGDTGAASRLQKFAGEKLSASGMVDTGTLAGTRAGTIDSNVVAVNEVAVGGAGTSGNEWGPA